MLNFKSFLNPDQRLRHGSALAALAIFGLGASSYVAAQPVEAAPPGPVFVIKGFNVTGENPLAEGETSKVLAPFLRADASLDTLQKATVALETALRDKGFALHRVALPPQDLGSTVTLNIVKFVIGKVVVEGIQNYTEANIRASLPELAEGSAPNFKTLSVQTTIANESQGKQVQVSLKESEEADRIDVRVLVKESKPWNFSTSVANTGSTTTGDDRFTISGGHANVFGRDHQFTGAYTTSLERPSGVRQIGLNHRIPLYGAGGVLGLSYTQSNVVGNSGGFSFTGAGQTMGLSYNHYLPPEGGYRDYFSIGVDDKLFNALVINGLPVAGTADRRSRPLTVGYTARVESDTAVWGYSAELAFNLAGGDGNTLAAYVTEDPRITTSGWRALKASANYSTSFAEGWLWSLKGQLQYSPDALISGEQFGIGGATSVRGTGERPISGDNGFFASTEVTTPEMAPGLRLLGFVDAGWLSNNNPNGLNKPVSDSLASVGLGLRFASPAGFVLSVDYGRVMTGSVVPFVPNSGIPQSGDHKLHLNFSARF